MSRGKQKGASYSRSPDSCFTQLMCTQASYHIKHLFTSLNNKQIHVFPL
nr:MAG TPA: hypothetical protein [Caudoviricetes sp.]